MESNDYVTSVTSLIEGGVEVGFVISFAYSDSIIIYHSTDGEDGEDGEDGTDGVTPIIGVQADTDGLYYCTITTGDNDTEWLLDASGNKVRTTGEDGTDGADGITPVVGVGTYGDETYWTVTVGDMTSWITDADGAKVPTTGANGSDATINYVDNGETVTFYFGDMSFTFEKYVSKVNFDSYAGDDIVLDAYSNTINVGLSEEVEESNFTSITAEVTLPDGSAISDTYVYTRASSTSDGWSISISNATFTNGVYNNDAVVTITAPDDAEGVVDLALTVTLNTEDGNSDSNTVEFAYDCGVTVATYTLADFDNMTTCPTISKWVITDTTAKGTDFAGLIEVIETRDGSGREISLEFPYLEAIPDYAMMGGSNNYSGISGPLVSIKADVATSIGDGAFYQTFSLISIEFPEVTSIGSRAFYNCASMSSMNILKASLIGESAFYHCHDLPSVELPEATVVSCNAFSDCYNLSSIKLPKATSIGCLVFRNCFSLDSFTIASTVTEIGGGAFVGCSSLVCESSNFVVDGSILYNNSDKKPLYQQ